MVSPDLHAQGNAFGALSSAARKTIGLTGTLIGGYSSNFHYINFRLNPENMLDEDIGYHQLSKWVSRYGVLEKITRHYDDEDNRYSRGKKGRTVVREKPGLSPAVFSRHLLGNSVFLRLDDISITLPPLSEEIFDVKMDDELESAYRQLEADLAAAMKAELKKGSKKLLSVDVIIANPKLVETGLDLYDFPTIIFFQTGYSVFTLRQASRRSWRIGQKKPVKIHYLFYRNTMQEKALQLIGSKLEASLAIEGKFIEEGLTALTSGEDMTTALAKALVDGLETEGVEQVWRKINEKNQDKRNQAPVQEDEEKVKDKSKPEIKPKTEEDPDRVVVVSFAKFISKRRKQVETIAVKASELKKVMKEKKQSAQLSIF